ANRNRDLNESISIGEKLVMGLIRVLVPPQTDNEKAANFLRVNIGQNNKLIEWVAVRPDTLINEDIVSEYELYASPTRSALFNPGKTRRKLQRYKAFINHPKPSCGNAPVQKGHVPEA
ncbi:MAG: hypothetical protein QNK35_03595, partial [Bacteroides sp.]|nr:hypothetical protein [Bacteroides sp.]